MRFFIVSLCLIAAVNWVDNSFGSIAFAKVRSTGKNTVEPSAANLEIGLRKYKEGDVDGAIDAFLQSIYFNRSSYNPQAYYWLGICYQGKKLDAKAIEALNKCVEQSIKPLPEAHIHLSELYLRNDRLAEAEVEANRALRDYQGPGPQAHNLLGLIAEKRDELSYAQDHFVDALGDKPWRYTEAWMNYSENLIKQKQWGYAITQLRNMLSSPKPLKELNHERVYLDIGICLLAKGDHQGAMDNWHEVLNYNPSNSAAHLQLALLLDSERHVSSAIKEYKEYIRLSPDNAEVVKIKNRVLLLEQQLRLKPSDPASEIPIGSPSDCREVPSDATEQPTEPESRAKELKSSNTHKRGKKKDVLEPSSGKESGF